VSAANQESGKGWGRGRREEAPLPACLSSVSHRWSLTHSERFALQFADGHRRYITENVSPHSHKSTL
jgi:hypothetical protein